jgi:hypothetical protein
LRVTYGEQADLARERGRIVRRAGNELRRGRETSLFAALVVAMWLLMRLACWRKSSQAIDLTGAGEGIRTLDPNLGKVVLYP